ncbi:MAG: ABC transporter substrate-binding protein, partial [Bacillota bacterium]|nr:ABC transporter substrate-binding protein [Bacillota bacterium]
MKTRIRKSIAAMIILALLIGLTACGSNSGQTASQSSSSKKQTIKIAYLPITHALPLFIENESLKENLKNVDIQLVKFGSWPELIDALNTGKVDGASVLIELAMKAKEQGIDLKAVALGHRDGNAVIVANNINSVQDLKGKTFAIPSKLSTHNILLYKMLKDSGVNYTDLKVVEMPPAEMPAALSEGRISGYIVAEPFGAKSVAIGKGKVLYQSQDIWKDSVCCSLVLRNDFIKKNPDAAQEFVNGYVKAGAQAETKSDTVKSISTKFMSVDSKVLDLSLKWIS